ncbi:FAD-dependent oxidoreductase [Sediminispirochaeta bajacaliforniensis]|uniref:FAD-dependent oxidoreductase n=1 Tax=Sediminispirochaeta bajacaliforniensis TaxID=148 RepID=UPI00037EA127|nr:FAD-dependent oxidoreductase [Sediminispirochaeta bajacaliforniensis]
MKSSSGKIMVSLLILLSLFSCSKAENVATLNNPDLHADVVVVGAGGAGLSAAIQARQLGLNVILLEKNGYPGGSTIMTEGMFAVGSHFQKEAGVKTSSRDILLSVEEYHHWIPDSTLLEKFFASSAETIDWLESLGVTFTGVSFMGDSVQTWHLFKGKGEEYINSLHKAATKAGVNLMLETPGKELVMEEGKVKGIIAEKKDGTKLNIEAPVVILATGGYSDNPEMMRKYAGINPENAVQIGMPGRTGDGINMGIDVGADTSNLGTVMYYGGNLKGVPYGTHLYTASAFQPTMVWVNQDGVRFADESIAGRNFSYSGNAIKGQDKVYSIMNKANLDYLVEKGCILGTGEYTVTGTKLTDLYKEMNEQLSKPDSGIFIADSLEKLATLIRVDKESLLTTMNNYNSYCEAGNDEEFDKASKFLVSMSEGPYYAFALEVGYFTTVGGLTVNKNAQVLDLDGNIIPGLYAAGSDAGGLYGDSYDVVYCAGSQQGWAVNSGRFAAKDAAIFLGKE